MKASSIPLIRVGCVFAGLLAGGIIARLHSLEKTEAVLTASQVPAAPSPAATGAASDLRHQVPEGRPSRLTRLSQLLDESTKGGGQSPAAAWKSAGHDPVLKAWLAQLWMKQDPGAFLRMFYGQEARDWESAESSMVYDLASGFVRQNPQEALKLIDGLPNPNARRWMMSQAILSIMESDSAQGLELAAAHPELRLYGTVNADKVKVTVSDIPLLMSLPGRGRDSMSSVLVKALKELPVEEAIKVTNQMSSISRNQIQTELVKRWVEEDPDAALNFARDGASYNQRLNILENLGQRKVAANPAEGAAWAEENLAGYARNRVLEKAADHLQKTDSAAAEAIRARLPQNYSPAPQSSSAK